MARLLGRAGQVAAVLAVALAVAGAVLLAGRIPAIEALRWQAVDSLFPTSGDARPFLVLVDRLSTDPNVRQRDLLARLVTELDDMGASAIFIDTTALALPREGLADAIAAAGNVVVSADWVVTYDEGGDPRRPWRPRIDLVLGPDAGSPGAARGFGLFKTRAPVDDRFRSMSLVAHTPDGLIPSAELAAFAVARGLDPTVLVLGRRSVEVDGHRIPTGPNGSLLLDFVDDLEPRRVAREAARAEQVLGGQVDPVEVRGRIVLIGDLSGDFALLDAPPGSDRSPTVVLRAVAVHTLEGGAQLSLLSGPASAAALAAVAAAVLVVARWVRPLFLVAVVGVVVAVTFVGAEVALDRGHVADPVSMLGSAGLASAAGLGWRGSSELRRRRTVSALFGAYVSSSVAAQLLDTDRSPLDEQRRHVAVLFADLRGFTTFSSDADPAIVRQVVEVFYDIVVRAALDREGTVMQFIGDEVFVVFGAPLDQPDAAHRALDCARAVLAARAEFQARVAAIGAPTIGFGIGVHAGEVVAVHAGTSLRRQYTVLGHTVNLGARLCSKAKAFEALTSSEVALEVAATDLEFAGAVDLKGLDEPVDTFRLLPPPPSA